MDWIRPALVMLLLAGCAAPSQAPAPTTSAPPALTVPASQVVLTGYGCEQAHHFFTAPASSLQPLLPPGFTVAEETPGTGSVVIYTTLCDSALAANRTGPTGEMWIGVAVEAPERYADDNLTLDLFTLTWIHSEPSVVALLRGLGHDARVQAGNVSTQETRVADNLVRMTTARSANESFSFDATAAADGSDFAPVRVRLWAGTPQGVVGSLVLATQPASSVAIGNVVFRYEGPDAGTPPVTDGVVHFVEGFEYALEWVPLPPEDPATA